MHIFNRDKVDLIKQDGSTCKDIAATVAGSELIVIKGGKQIIDVGDLISRSLSNGGNETYQVVDPRYYERTPGAAGPHYQLHVKKLGLPEAQAAIQQITYNVTGNNARVNVGSVDNSTNSVVVGNFAEHIKTIRDELQKLEMPETDRADALEVVDAVELELAKSKPKRAVISTLLDALPKVATISGAVAKIGGLIADGAAALGHL